MPRTKVDPQLTLERRYWYGLCMLYPNGMYLGVDRTTGHPYPTDSFGDALVVPTPTYDEEQHARRRLEEHVRVFPRLRIADVRVLVSWSR